MNPTDHRLSTLPDCRCGGRPQLVKVGYGNDHFDIECTRCALLIECDHTVKHCAKAWRKEMEVA